MAIKYYPNRPYKGVDTAIDRVLAKRRPVKVEGSQDISATALNVTLSANTSWLVDSISFVFSSTAPRAYSASVKGGRKVVENLNDFLFFRTDQVLQRKITLDPGFYDGSELATHLQSKMNADSSFLAAGYSFAVVYSPITGLFTITPNKGTVEYIENNPRQVLSMQQSIAGHLFGLNVNTGLVPVVSSDTPVFGLEMETPIIVEAAGTQLTRHHDDMHTLSIDQALVLASNSGPAVTIDYSVVYEEIV